jgi:hypothetical protein
MESRSARPELMAVLGHSKSSVILAVVFVAPQCKREVCNRSHVAEVRFLTSSSNNARLTPLAGRRGGQAICVIAVLRVDDGSSHASGGGVDGTLVHCRLGCPSRDASHAHPHPSP